MELKDLDGDKEYDIGETFSDRDLNNLDIYLISTDRNNETVCSSVSEVDSVEHIFCPIPETGSYKIRVHYRQQVNESVQPYILAWWTLPTPPLIIN